MKTKRKPNKNKFNQMKKIDIIFIYLLFLGIAIIGLYFTSNYNHRNVITIESCDTMIENATITIESCDTMIENATITGRNEGLQYTLAALIQESITCKTIPINYGEYNYNLIAIECLDLL